MSRSGRAERAAPLGAADHLNVFAGLENARAVLAAVSGGPDSTALMGCLAEWAAHRPGPSVLVATVDHGLREASRAEADGVAAICAAMGLRHAILTWTGERAASVSQETARRARYRLLVAHAHAVGATHLVTAHTQDDQAETLMLRLAAGSGLSGLAGMRRETTRGGLRHVRPFLDVPKARLVATCRERGWPFVDDPTNSNADFARVRWRKRLMPLLAAEGLDGERLARLAARLARADEALDQVALAVHARVVDQDSPGIDLRALGAEPWEVALRVLKRALADRGAGNTESLSGEARHLRLDRLEDALEALLAAAAAGKPVRRTLAGCLLHLDRRGALTLAPEGVRRRGKRDPVTPIGLSATASLGREPERA